VVDKGTDKWKYQKTKFRGKTKTRLNDHRMI